MVTCPRCAQQVDEKTSTTCPRCSAPLTTAAPSYAPQLARSGGTRVSLTGEVIEDQPTAAPPSFVGGGGARAVGLAKPQRTGASLTEAPAKSASLPILPILIGLLVLGGLGAGGWWFLMPHSNPKTVVKQFDTAIAAQDWKTIYTDVEMSSEDKSKYPSADAFASSMTDRLTTLRANPMAAPLVDAVLKGYQTAQVGEPTITGDTATVPVTMTISFTIMGKSTDKTNTEQVSLKKFNGVWKIDGLPGTLSGAGAAGSM